MIIGDRKLVAPRCLAALHPTPADPPLRNAMLQALFPTEPGVAPETVVWSLTCPCGEAAGRLHGTRKDDRYTPPVFFTCSECAESTLVFNPKMDGWNREVAKRRSSAKDPTRGTFAWHCPECKEVVFNPAVLVTYQGDHYADVPDDRWQDYFDVIGIGGTCTSCDHVSFAYDEECT